tara:strand:- start:76 stop:579 length:504 start_codon:yes stop_codon:yes gene_type:complete
MGNLGESFDTAWKVVKEEPEEYSDDWLDDPKNRDKLNREMGDNDPQNACPECGSYRYPLNEYCRDCFDGATPKDRNNPNPHPLDGMLDDSFVSANEAYSLWDEGYEPDYDSVVEAAKNVLEAMGYKVSKPDEIGIPREGTITDEMGYDWERENRDNLEPNKEMRRRK